MSKKMANELQALLHLFRYISPIFPTGSFSYSRGLEGAVHLRWITNEEDALSWLEGILKFGFSRLDGPIFLRLRDYLLNDDHAGFIRANDLLLASRESKEIRLEDIQMGDAISQIVNSELTDITSPIAIKPISFTTGFARATHYQKIPPDTALTGLMWLTVESMVSAAIRLVPLGQTAGQRILVAMTRYIEECLTISKELPEEEIGMSLCRVAMTSAWHEKQYTRLFRS